MAANFLKEVLTFEVVGFRGAYHAILGRPCYAKFMTIPNYTYLKMKMPGPKGVITIGSSFEHAYECDVECVEHAEALAVDETLTADMEKMANEAWSPRSGAQAASSLPRVPRTYPSTRTPPMARH